MREDGRSGYLSKTVHSTMIADPDGPVIPIDTAVWVWGTNWVVNHHGRSVALNYVYGDVVSPGKCQDLWFPTPDPGITYGGAVHFELPRGYKASICGAYPIFTVH